MKRSVFEKKGLIVLAGVMVLLLGAIAGVGHASTIIQPGFNLFNTPGPGEAPPGTMFDFGGALGLQDLKGLPLNTFDFTTLTTNGPNAVDVGNTDTIVRRITAAGPGILGSDTIDIELVALSLVSVNSFNFGFGLEQALITLNTDAGSTMTINGLDSEGDPHGTFDSTLIFTFDIFGLISGAPIILNLPKTIVSTGNQWRHAPTGLTIDGINHFLVGPGNITGDLFPLNPVLHDNVFDKHTAVTATPEPGTAVLIGMGLVGLGMKRGRRGVIPLA